MKNQYYIFILVLLLLTTKSFSAEMKAAVSLEGDTFNFELTGRKNWDYDLKRVNEKNQSKVLLYVKALSEETINQIKNIDNPFVKSVTATKNAVDNKWLIEFVLKNKQIESFDYLTDQPSKLIVDFYKSENEVAEINPSNTKAQSKTDIKTSKVPLKNVPKAQITKNETADRKPAEADVLRIDGESGLQSSVLARAGLYDASDSQFSRFTMNASDYKEESVIKSRGNYYLKFPVLESEFSFWNKMNENPPNYEVKPENTEENKQARLLVTLFKKKRYLVFLQTAEWFKAKYPKSKYDELISYMSGDAFSELWRSEKIETLYEQAQNAYRLALDNYPDSSLAERTSLYTGMLAIEKTDQMSAIRKLRAHIDNSKYDNKISKHYAKIGLAYSYSKINKLEDALQFLTEIEKNTKDTNVLAEVAVRRGDFNFNSKRLNEAIDAYDIAIKKFSIVSKLYPSAFFNKMEAQFWQSKYPDSHQSALGFAQNFPTHEFAPYALTRVGELLDILGADQSKAIGAYLETHFRYGDSPKTIVARLHLLSTRMKSMKSEELEQTLVKMDELAAKSTLENVDQFKVAMLSDGFSRRKDYLRAIDILSKFYQLNPTRPDARQVTRRIVKNINDQLKLLSDQGNFKELLKTYKQYSDTWLKTYPRTDTDYFIGLSYDNAGAYGDAIEKYKKVLAEMNAIKGTDVEKETYVNQYLPSFDAIHLKLAKASYESGSFQDAYQYLQKIQKPLGLIDQEQVERVSLASKLYEQKGDEPTAIRYLSELSQFWSGKNQLVTPILFRLAELQAKNNNVNESLNTYEKCRKILLNSESPSEKDIVDLLNAYSHELVKAGKKDEAIAFMSEMIAKHGEKFTLNQERFYLGNLYFEKGEINKADQAWSQLKNEGENLWKKLSKEKLRQASWDVEYKKHLKRIPAMSQLGEQK